MGEARMDDNNLDELTPRQPADSTPNNFLDYAAPSTPRADTRAWLRLGLCMMVVSLAMGFCLGFLWLGFFVGLICFMHGRFGLRGDMPIAFRVIELLSSFSAMAGFGLVYIGTDRHAENLVRYWSIFKLVDDVQTGLWILGASIVVFTTVNVIAVILARKSPS